MYWINSAILILFWGSPSVFAQVDSHARSSDTYALSGEPEADVDEEIPADEFEDGDTESGELCQRCLKQNSIDLQVLGFGTTVGLGGVIYTHHSDGHKSYEAGLGIGLLGVQMFAQRVFHLEEEGGLAGTLGLSYTNGGETRNGRRGEKVADAIWVNLGVGIRFQSKEGYRYTLELIAGVAAASELSRKNEEGEPGEVLDPQFRISKVEPGDMVLGLSLLRFGYAF